MLGSKLKLIRTWMKMTQETLSCLTGLSTKSISKYENREVIPSQKQRDKLADGLGVEYNYFDSHVSVIPVPAEWADIAHDPQIQYIIGRLVEMDSRSLADIENKLTQYSDHLKQQAETC